MLVLGLTLTWLLFLLCFFMGLAAWLIFMWAVRAGQFKDAEETAEQMLALDSAEYEMPELEQPGDRDDGTVTVGANDDPSHA